MPIVSHPIIVQCSAVWAILPYPIASHPSRPTHARTHARTVVQLADLAQSNRFGPPVHHKPCLTQVLCYPIAPTNRQPPNSPSCGSTHYYSLPTCYLLLLDHSLACATRLPPPQPPHPRAQHSLCCPVALFLSPRLASIASSNLSPSPSRLARLQTRSPRDGFRTSATRDATDSPISPDFLDHWRQKVRLISLVSTTTTIPSPPRPQTGD